VSSATGTVAFDGFCFTEGHSSFDGRIGGRRAQPGWPVFSPASDATDRSWL
jgi:hypothetical protein